MIKHIPPPNYAMIKKYFPTVDFENGTVFTYAPHIYIKNHIYEDLLVHEQTHLKQQTSLFETPISWWNKYIKDPIFRLQQEVEAYHNQYKNSPQLLHALSTDLSSPLYALHISYKEAKQLIKNG